MACLRQSGDREPLNASTDASSSKGVLGVAAALVRRRRRVHAAGSGTGSGAAGSGACTPSSVSAHFQSAIGEPLASTRRFRIRQLSFVTRLNNLTDGRTQNGLKASLMYSCSQEVLGPQERHHMSPLPAPRTRGEPTLSTKLEHEFFRLDSSRSGTLSKEEVAEGLRGRGLPCSKDDI
jgi:hypothetical protein